MIGSFVFQALALYNGRLSVVQSILVTGLVVFSLVIGVAVGCGVTCCHASGRIYTRTAALVAGAADASGRLCDSRTSVQQERGALALAPRPLGVHARGGGLPPLELLGRHAMYPEPFVQGTGWEPRKKPGHVLTWAGESQPPYAGRYLAAVGRSINVSDELSRPLYAMLMTEDFCWQIIVAEWRGRRPFRRKISAYAARCAEAAEIEQQKARIRDLAAELGLVTAS